MSSFSSRMTSLSVAMMTILVCAAGCAAQALLGAGDRGQMCTAGDGSSCDVLQRMCWDHTNPNWFYEHRPWCQEYASALEATGRTMDAARQTVSNMHADDRTDGLNFMLQHAGTDWPAAKHILDAVCGPMIHNAPVWCLQFGEALLVANAHRTTEAIGVLATGCTLGGAGARDSGDYPKQLAGSVGCCTLLQKIYTDGKYVPADAAKAQHFAAEPSRIAASDAWVAHSLAEDAAAHAGEEEERRADEERRDQASRDAQDAAERARKEDHAATMGALQQAKDNAGSVDENLRRTQTQINDTVRRADAAHAEAQRQAAAQQRAAAEQQRAAAQPQPSPPTRPSAAPPEAGDNCQQRTRDCFAKSQACKKGCVPASTACSQGCLQQPPLSQKLFDACLGGCISSSNACAAACGNCNDLGCTGKIGAH